MYTYQVEKGSLFTDQGQRMFLKIRDRTKHLLSVAGAVKLSKAIEGMTGDSWSMYACMDRMVELGEIVEITPNDEANMSDRVFVEVR